jgi:hypothetical protein
MNAVLDALRDELLTGRKAISAAYAAKQIHPVPDFPVVDRQRFVLDQCAGKRVLELGASGPLHAALVGVAASVVGIDKVDGEGVVGFDLDDVSQPTLPIAETPDLVLCGEVLEHLGNPGYLLQRLRQQCACPLLVTVPNAFSDIARKALASGIESVNREHVAWYSWHTLAVLLDRYGYVVRDTYWYHGQPRTAEGLIMVTE